MLKKSVSTPPTSTGFAQPTGVTPGIKNNMVTDNQDMARTLDGDEFNRHPPSPVSNPVISIPGTGVGNLTSLCFDERMLSTHTVLLGGIGTGKSNTFNHIISQIRQKMTSDDVAIIFDTKGDFYRNFARPQDIVISNDIRAKGTNGADYWNIFDEVDPKDADNSIREISTNLFKQSVEKSSNAFFPNAASDLFYAFMSIFYKNWKSMNGTDPTNEDLMEFFRNATSQYLLEVLNGEPGFGSVAGHISDPSSAQSQGVIAEMNSVVNKIFVGNFRKRGSIALSRIVKERGGRTVFIEYDIKAGETLTPIYSLMVDMALKQALSSTSGHKGSVYLFVDEFKLLPNLAHIDDAVNFGRSLGMKVFIGLQSITQMYDSYGEMKAKSILSGFLNCMFFNVNNYESRQFIKEHFGQCLRRVMYGQGLDYVYLDDVVKDKYITRLKVGEAVIGMPNTEPFVFRFDEWRP